MRLGRGNCGTAGWLSPRGSSVTLVSTHWPCRGTGPLGRGSCGGSRSVALVWQSSCGDSHHVVTCRLWRHLRLVVMLVVRLVIVTLVTVTSPSPSPSRHRVAAASSCACHAAGHRSMGVPVSVSSCRPCHVDVLTPSRFQCFRSRDRQFRYAFHIHIN